MIFWCLTSTKLAFLSRRATKFLEVTTQEICYLCWMGLFGEYWTTKLLKRLGCNAVNWNHISDQYLFTESLYLQHFFWSFTYFGIKQFSYRCLLYYLSGNRKNSCRCLFHYLYWSIFFFKFQNNGQVDMILARQLGMQVQGLDVVIFLTLMNFFMLSSKNFESWDGMEWGSHTIYFSIKILLLINRSLTFVTLFWQASLGSNHLFRFDT